MPKAYVPADKTKYSIPEIKENTRIPVISSNTPSFAQSTIQRQAAGSQTLTRVIPKGYLVGLTVCYNIDLPAGSYCQFYIKIIDREKEQIILHHAIYNTGAVQEWFNDNIFIPIGANVEEASFYIYLNNGLATNISSIGVAAIVTNLV